MRKLHALKHFLKQIRLSLLFSAVVFLIMNLTSMLVFSVMTLLSYLGVVKNLEVIYFPVLVFALACTVTGAVISLAVSRMPLRPLREVMRATDSIAQGDYSVRLDLKGPEEFRELSTKFNHMAEELGSVEMLRSDFINNFSHEFKTPIVSIRGFARALKLDDLTEEERREYLDIIIQESERLSDLSANVLYLSRIETQPELTACQPLNVTEQIRLTIALLDHKCTEKNLEVTLEGEDYTVPGNEEMLRQVWINLLNNAIKFSPEGGTIAVLLEEKGAELSVAIRDQGPGIAPEAQAHIFDKFYQGDTSHATQGNGLGLAIVKKIVELHRGTVSVQSDGPGSTFLVTLPLCTVSEG